ncbi:MAG: adenylate/guanylate cyclase domain-containing protein [Gemmatimonadota bacterium]
MKEPQHLTTLFADVSGSTRLFEQRGDHEARRIIAAVLEALTEVVQGYSGRVVKTIGDEVMCTFPGPTQGLLAACDMQQRVAREPDFARDDIGIRVGLHHGATLVEDGDIYGDSVNTAARMAALAKREQIITTTATLEGVTSGVHLSARALGQVRVRGKQLPVEVVDIIWQEDTSEVTTVQQVVRVGGEPADLQLRLRHRDTEIIFTQDSEPLSIGRDAGNSLTVPTELASRNHAVLECRGAYFALVDRSTNATFVRFGDDEELRVHREEIRLRGSGTISLGQVARSNPADLVYFECA